MKGFLTALIAVLSLAVPAAAMATTPDTQDPCAPGHNPTTLCGDTISVDQPTAEECPNGGMVLVVNDVRYPVCNGTDGTAGATGPAGADGAAGADGQTGATGAAGATGTDGTAGTAGVDGVRGQDGAPGVVQQARQCVSKRYFSIRLRTKALRHAKTVRVRVAGKTHSMHPNKNGRVWIDLRGMKSGVYAVVARNGGGTDARVYTVCAAGNVSNVTLGTVH